MTRIAIVVGSTRPGRTSIDVARWVHHRASERSDASFEIVDLADHDLPHLDEPTPAAMGSDYIHAHTRAWSDTIAAFDGYVFVTPEYNHSTSGVLKNAIDHLYVEWRNKAAGFVSYGLDGGTRAVEHIRLIMAELHVAGVRSQVALSMFDDVDDQGRSTPRPRQTEKLDVLLDEVIAWTDALEPLRTAEEVA